MQKSVYLAGPIAGLNYVEATDWRQSAIEFLRIRDIRGLSPMRCKEYLRDIDGGLSASCDLEGTINVLSTPRCIMTRDRFDATRCDLLLVNFMGATKVSIGTAMEIAWADLSRIPIVCAMEPGNVHEHAMINEAIGFRAHSLEEALTIALAVL